MSAVPLPDRPRLPGEVAFAAAEAGNIAVDILEGAVEAALWPGGPEAHQPSWRSEAECATLPPGFMYPDRGEDTEFQKAVCRRCPVQASCLGDALYHGEKHGVWGATSERNRRKLRQVLREAGIMGVVGEPAYLAWQELDLEPPERSELAALPDPWPHQTAAVLAIGEELAGGGVCQVAMATASGKTLVAVWAAELLDADRVLVLVPNLALVTQAAEVWDRYRPLSPRLAVCSDSGEAELRLDATTDHLDVRDFMAGAGPRLVFGTYASSQVLAEADCAFDLIVADEAHVLAGAIDKAFSVVLRAEIPAKATLYMTATPKRYRKSRDVDVVSMDEDGPFGKRVYDFKLSDAVAADVIADYRVVVAAVERPVFEAVARHPDLEGIDPHLLAGAIAVVRAMGEGQMSSCLSFHSRVERARTFARLIGPVAEVLADERPSGPGWAGYVHGGASVRIRRRLLARLGDDRCWGVLANAKAMGLGIDVPSLDAVAIVDPKSSETDILQATGRALRRPTHAKVGTVILPVLLSEGADPDDPLSGCDDRSLELVGNVLRALRAHDDELGTRLDKIRRWEGSRGHHAMTSGHLLRKRAAKGLLRSRVELHLPGGATGDLAGALALFVVREASPSWEMAYGLLQRWVSERGTARVAHNAEAVVTAPTASGTFDLAGWVSRQRALYRDGLLPPERAEQLGGMAGWRWNPADELWWESFDALADYVATKGEYPQHAGDAWRTKHNGVRVGSFLTTCRQAYKSWLARFPDRIAALEALPRWAWNTNDAQWEESFTRLERWLAANDGVWPTVNQYVDSIDIGRWVAKQRARVRATDLDVPLVPKGPGKGHLSVERIVRLRALPGWTDDANLFRNDQWYANVERVRAYYYANKLRYPTMDSTDADGIAIGAWLATQRDRYTRGKLSEHRIAALEGLPQFVWYIGDHAGRWQRRYDLVARYAAAHPDGARITSEGAEWEGVKLYPWCKMQRARYEAGKLTAAQVEQLEALPGWSWRLANPNQELALGAVAQWLGANGPVDPPKREKIDGLSLHNWFSYFRDGHDAGTLADGVTERLEALPGWSWTARKRRAA